MWMTSKMVCFEEFSHTPSRMEVRRDQDTCRKCQPWGTAWEDARQPEEWHREQGQVRQGQTEQTVPLAVAVAAPVVGILGTWCEP